MDLTKFLENIFHIANDFFKVSIGFLNYTDERLQFMTQTGKLL